MKLGVKRVAFDGILTGLALVSYILESLLPQTFLPVPGVKIGLSNIFTLVGGDRVPGRDYNNRCEDGARFSYLRNDGGFAVQPYRGSGRDDFIVLTVQGNT